MPKRTITDRVTTGDDIEAEIDEVVAAWDRAELQNKRARARDVVLRRRFEQGLQARPADIPFWERDLARHGCRPVVAAWPSCPVPPVASASFAPTEHMPELKKPRPVIYDAATYRLDGQGIWLRQAGYWISSPVFQIARGRDDTNPSLYAVAVDGTWRTVPVDPRRAAGESGVLPSALTGAGLRVNPEPIHLDVNLNAVAPRGTLGHGRHTAWEWLARFLDSHARELPVRP